MWVVGVPRLRACRLLGFRSILFAAGTEAWLWRGGHAGDCPVELELGGDWPCSRAAPHPHPHSSSVLVTEAVSAHGR